MEQPTGDHPGSLRYKIRMQRESSHTTRSGRSANETELNKKQDAWRVQVGTLQAVAHRIEQKEEKEARRAGGHAPGGLGTGPN